MTIGAESVRSLESMLGNWTLHSTTNGYFDIRPRIDSAWLDYQSAGRGWVKFFVRFQVRERTFRFRGRARAEMASAHGYNWWGLGAWLIASRAKWTLMQSNDGLIAVVRNGGSMMAEPGALVIARSEVSRAAVRARMESEFRVFGLSSAEYQTMRWRSLEAAAEIPAAI